MESNWEKEIEKEKTILSYIEKGYYRLSLLKPGGFEDESWHHDKVLNCWRIVGNSELWNEVFKGNKEICLKKVVGTSHPEYCKGIEKHSFSWIELLGRLEKFYRNIDFILKGDIPSICNNIGLEGYNGKYFIASNGNNRTIMMKFAGVELVPIKKVYEYRDY